MSRTVAYWGLLAINILAIVLNVTNLYLRRRYPTTRNLLPAWMVRGMVAMNAVVLMALIILGPRP